MGRIVFGFLVFGIGLVSLASVTVAAAAAPQLTATLSSDFLSTNLTWTGEPGPSGYFLIERSITGSETAPRTFEGIADLQVTTAGPFAYRDESPGPGWNCYRVRAKAENLEYSNEVCVVNAASALPVPAGVTFTPALPIPPDFIGVPRIVAWAWPPESVGMEAVIEASVPPRFSSVQPPFIVYARIPASALPRVSVTTLEWRGPYCFRIRFSRGSELGPPSDPVCVAKVRENSPYDVTTLRVLRTASNQVWLEWEYLFLPTTMSIQRTVAPDAEERSWTIVAEDIPVRGNGTSGRWDDPNPPPGYVCYRVKVNRGGMGEFGEDTAWSAERCSPTVPPRSPGYPPFAPDVGNSPAVAMPEIHYRWQFTVVGILLLVVGLVNWWAFRSYR